MEWVNFSVVLLLAALVALVESQQLSRNNLSQEELQRRSDAGDTQAKHELKVRGLLPLFFGLQRLKVTFLVALLVSVAFASFGWLGAGLALVLLLLVGLAVSKGLIVPFVAPLLKILEPHLFLILQKAAPVLQWFAPPAMGEAVSRFASKDELLQMISRDTTILSKIDKARLLAVAQFSHKTVADYMVPRDKIISIDEKEAVGPVLLDRLHKGGHAVLPVVKKDLDHVVGLLYMSDLTPLHPDIKTVGDATRPKVITIEPTVQAQEIIKLSLKTNKHFFLVGEGKKVVGLVTLHDALAALLGEKL